MAFEPISLPTTPGKTEAVRWLIQPQVLGLQILGLVFDSPYAGDLAGKRHDEQTLLVDLRNDTVDRYAIPIPMPCLLLDAGSVRIVQVRG